MCLERIYRPLLRRYACLFFAVAVVPVCAVAQVCTAPNTYSAVIPVDAGGVAYSNSLQQTFTVPPGYERIWGQVRFATDVTPGSPYNDFFAVWLLLPPGMPGSYELLAGNVNTLQWGTGVAGFRLATPWLEYRADLMGLVGKTVTLKFLAADVDDPPDGSDSDGESALIVQPVRVVRTDRLLQGPVGSIGHQLWQQSYGLGQVVSFTVTNRNLLGVNLQVDASANGGDIQSSDSWVIPPQLSRTFAFRSWGGEPIMWMFQLTSQSSAVNLTYSIKSTWVEGMPPNPCP